MKALTREQFQQLKSTIDITYKGNASHCIRRLIGHIEAIGLYAAPDSDAKRVTRMREVRPLPDLDLHSRPKNDGAF